MVQQTNNTNIPLTYQENDNSQQDDLSYIGNSGTQISITDDLNLDHHDLFTALSVVSGLNIAVSIADAGSYLYEGEYVTAFTMLGVGMIPGGKLGMKIVGSGFRATKKVGFFQDTYYGLKVKKQMLKNDSHGFPEIVTNYESFGTVRTITPRDPKRIGESLKELRIPGSYRGHNGDFSFIKENNGEITHRLFERNR